MSSRYHLMELLGKGVQAVVYLAVDIINHEQVAIKVFDEKKEAHDEYKVLSTLSLFPNCDPYILCIRELTTIDDKEAIVMEYLTIPTLKEFMKTVSDPLLIWTIIYQILTAIHHLHSRGIVHMDVHEGNMMWTGSFIKLIDFGNARLEKYNSDKREDVQAISFILKSLLPEFPSKVWEELYSKLNYGLSSKECLLWMNRNPIN